MFLALALVAPFITHVPSEDGLLLIARIIDSEISWIETSSGKTMNSMIVARGTHEIVVSPNGRTLVAAGYGGSELSVVDVTSRKFVRTIPLVGEIEKRRATFRQPHGVTFLSDNRTVLVTSEATARLLVVDTVEGVVKSSIPTGQRLSHMVLALPGEKRALVANKTDGSVSVIDLVEGKLERIIKTGAGAQGMALHKARNEVWVANIIDDSMSVLDATTLEEIAEFPCGTYPVRVAFTPDGENALVVCYETGRVSVISVKTKKIIREIELPRAVPGQHRSHNRGPEFDTSPMPVGIIIADRAYVSCTRTDVVCAIDLSSWKIVKTYDVGRSPDGLAWVKQG